MADTKKTAKSGTKRRKKASRKKAIVEKAIERFEAKLDGDDVKASVGDFIRLLQLDKELEQEEDRPKEIKVTWVEPDATECEPGK